jgi:hypothetical protein
MTKGWQRTLTRPVTDRHTGKVMRTLDDARAFMIKLEDEGLRVHWQSAARKLLDAAEGGSVEACTRQIELAMLLSGRLKPNKDL